MPIAHYQETCVTVTWIKFNQQLLRLTGEAKYADAIEQTLYNALLGAMRPDGSDWAKYTPLAGQRLEGSEQCGMGLNCCNASGPRGLFTIPHTCVMQSEQGISLNFYIDGTYQLQTPGEQTIRVVQKTDYPQSGKIDIKLELLKNEQMEIALRIPAWSSSSIVSVNGMTPEKVTPGDYLRLTRDWKNNDLISVEFEMKGKLHRMGDQPQFVAVTRGPILLARDERLGDPALEAILAPVLNEDGTIDVMSRKPSDPNMWMLFSADFIPESYTEQGAKQVTIDFCDYASAGNTRNGFPFFRVWMPQLYNPKN